MLSPEQIAAFVEDGFVLLEGAFPRQVGERCRDELWDATGYDPNDPSAWTESLVRIDGIGTPAFQEAANTPALHEAFDQLVGRGGWIPRDGLGTFPLRFPSTEPAREAGWHVEYSYLGPAGEPRLNLRSRDRALLMLFLFSDVGEDDAPTKLRVGSHRDVPALLEPAGDAGVEWMPLCMRAVPLSQHRPVASATGRLGDVYLCHPFIVHTAQDHRGTTPRFMAQPPLMPTEPLDLTASSPTPVAEAVLRGLGSRRT